jgi:3-oxoacyl-[acyl-carrier-protein] synthase-1
MSPIPIISMGSICAAGHGVQNGYAAVREGRDCLTPLSLFESGLKEVPLCGQVNSIPETILEVKAPNRTAALALMATQEAMTPVLERGGLRLGIILATTVGGMTQSELFYRELKEDPDIIGHAGRELMYHEPTAITGLIASHIKADGFHTISTACSTSLHALGMAKRLIEQNTYDLCLAIGVDALSILTVRGFASLMLIDFSGCKPFDKRRVGISLGEGAGALLVSSEKALVHLGIKPLAAVAGWGASADGYHMTAPHPEGEGARLAAIAALAEAGISPAEIDMIATHGTATPDNDLSEINAMRSIFSDLPPFCSMKRTLGHTLAASGSLEAIFSVCALNDETVPATAGFEEVDEAIGTGPSLRAERPMKHILKNSFGFGGNNASVVISTWDQDREAG